MCRCPSMSRRFNSSCSAENGFDWHIRVQHPGWIGARLEQLIPAVGAGRAQPRPHEHGVAFQSPRAARSARRATSSVARRRSRWRPGRPATRAPAEPACGDTSSGRSAARLQRSEKACSPLARPISAQALRGASGPPWPPPATIQRSTLARHESALGPGCVFVRCPRRGDQVARAQQRRTRGCVRGPSTRASSATLSVGSSSSSTRINLDPHARQPPTRQWPTAVASCSGAGRRARPRRPVRSSRRHAGS